MAIEMDDNDHRLSKIGESVRKEGGEEGETGKAEGRM
jgi:hypothetical protein